MHLGDQVISPELYSDALMLSHLARSVFAESCRAVRRQGVAIDRENPETCAVDPRFMAAFGDRDTMAMIGRLYRKIAVAIGATEEAQLQIESMIPATAAGRAFDLVGFITGLPPGAKVTGAKFRNPFLVDYLSTERADCPKRSKLPLVLGAIGVLAGGVAAGWALTRD